MPSTPRSALERRIQRDHFHRLLLPITLAMEIWQTEAPSIGLRRIRRPLIMPTGWESRRCPWTMLLLLLSTNNTSNNSNNNTSSKTNKCNITARQSLLRSVTNRNRCTTFTCPPPIILRLHHFNRRRITTRPYFRPPSTTILPATEEEEEDQATPVELGLIIPVVITLPAYASRINNKSSSCHRHRNRW